jgi:tRNA A-37 threonylcarbamoyl transferase component Bud32
MSDKPDEPDSPETLALLDAYLEQLQAGARPDREAILRDHPELQSTLACLDALESFAPPDDSGGEGPAADDAEPSEEAMPRDFGDYELLHEIGRGGMGVVYRARQRGLDRSVAIKMILASHLASAEHVRRFQDEARAAAGLRHPHIVHIHEVGQCHGQHYFTMEYIEGMSLAERIARGPTDPQDAARLVRTVARAVHHLHEHGIVHRDLKPSNILLDSEGQPYVTDFGLAKFFTADSRQTATGVIAGTPSYMAPEQASGQGAQVGPATDVYSLGVILYELLTGQPPFRRENPLDTLLMVLGSEPVPPRQLQRRIPRELEWVCLKCLSRSPADRYASAEALADELNRFLKGEVLQARAPGLAHRLWSWARRKPALASRLATLGAFYLVDLFNYCIAKVVDTQFHWRMTALTGLWVVTAIVFQQFLKSPRWSIPARFVWGVLDSLLLLGVLLVTRGAASSLLVGYPLLVAASGLWYRVRYVWFVAGLSLASYAVLIVDFYHWRPDLQKECYPGFDRHVVVLVAIVAMAAVVSYLVARVRALSSYLGQRL